MNKNIQILILVTLSFFYQAETFAQTVAGGEIYYELISAKKYKVTAHLYRMCDGDPLNDIKANVYGDTMIRPMHFTRIAIRKINDTCGNPCNKQNAISNAGFEQHTYVDTIDFNIAPYDVFVSKKVCVVNFGIRQALRYASPTTHDYGQFYLDASTNICLNNIVKNNSPQFSMEPKLYAGCNLPIFYSPGPLDTTDNDSVSFSLVDVQSNYKTNLAYNGSLTAQIPLSPFCLPPGVLNCKALPNAKPPRGFYFDNRSCFISATPSDCNEKGTIKYQIDEFRFNRQTQKYEWLGFVTREMFVQILKLPDNNLSTLTQTGNLQSVCEGNKICFAKKATDALALNQKKADTTTIFWDHGILDATFKIRDTTAREKEADFCWQPSQSKQRLEKYYFTIGAFDQKCNEQLTSNTIIVRVKPLPKYTYKHSASSCGLLKWNTTVFDSSYPENIGVCATKIKNFQTNNVLYSSNKLIDSINLHDNGKVIIEHTFNSKQGFNCPLIVIDTITIFEALALPDISDNKDSVICQNNRDVFHFYQSKVVDFKKFKWFLNGSFINETDTTIILNIKSSSNIKLQIEDTKGCLAERTLNYTLRQHDAILGNGHKYCFGDSLILKVNLIGLKPPVSVGWQINRKYASSDSVLKTVVNEDKRVYVLIIDSINCAFIDSSINLMNPLLGFKLVVSSSDCNDSIASVKASALFGTSPFDYSWRINANDTLHNDSVFNLKIKNNARIDLNIKDKNLCSYSDTIDINKFPKLDISLPKFFQTCSNDSILFNPNLNNRSSNIYYQWFVNNNLVSNDTFLYRKFATTSRVRLKVGNDFKCSDEDSSYVAVYPTLPLAISGKLIYNNSEFIVLKTNNSYKKYEWFNGKTTANDSFWAYELGLPDAYSLWCKTTDSNGCYYSDTVGVLTNYRLTIEHLESNVVKIYPNPATTQLNIENQTTLNIQLFAMDGKLLLNQTFNAGLNTLDISAYAPGIYLLKTLVDDHFMVSRIVKE
ncbi:MAG: T9SS type A sorting domain-containing protein [bacterium]|nr:T9SS type A sorting domain-containing protein [bacterium]